MVKRMVKYLDFINIALSIELVKHMSNITVDDDKNVCTAAITDLN